jgi:ABC-type uncharacterized transport system ATPase subunit
MVCDRVAILVQGEVVMQGTLHELTAESHRYEIVVQGPAPDWANLKDGLRVQSAADGQTRLILPSAEPLDAQPIIDRLRRDQRIICSVRQVRETLEDLFMRAVTDPATGRERAIGAPRD